MALVKATLLEELRKIFDQEYSGFEGFPIDSFESGERWAAAVRLYSETIIPVVTSASLDLAELAMESVIATINASSGNGITQLPIAFTNFAAQIALGMLPAFVGTPPSAPIDFTAVYAIGNAGGSSEDCANAMADIIDFWFKTGTAVPSGGGSPIFWS